MKTATVSLLVFWTTFAAICGATSRSCSQKTTSGQCCVFPFIYGKKRYAKCTTVDNGNTPWCSTTANYDRDGKWGNCKEIEMEDEYCKPEDATNIAISSRLLYKDGCSLPTKFRIFEATYDLPSSCAQKCLQEPFCTGYNFKHILKKRNLNCQLAITEKLNDTMSNCIPENKGWLFYSLLGPRKVHCSRMKNCKNGGITGDLCEYTLFSGSIILFGILHEYRQLLQTWIGRSFTATQLCWRAGRDGWASTTFHNRCDHKNPTVTFIKVRQYIFGFYVTESWHGNNYKEAPGSFIFSLRNNENLAPFKISLKENGIHARRTFGPTVGRNYYIYIADHANSSMKSYAKFNSEYETPVHVSNKRTILAGTTRFSPSEVEVFHLV